MTTANGYVLGFDGELRLRLEVSVSRSVVDSEDEGGVVIGRRRDRRGSGGTHTQRMKGGPQHLAAKVQSAREHEYHRRMCQVQLLVTTYGPAGHWASVNSVHCHSL